mgnify:CR=1 FL=1
MARAAEMPAENTRYLDIVQRGCDAILENAVDRYGPQHTGMILSVLDRKTGKPLNRTPEGSTGVRWSDRTGTGGSNASLQQDLYRVLYNVSRLTGEEKYSDAADHALKDFMVITQSPNTGFLAWGEHLYWNCFEDRLGDEMDKGHRTHEPKRSWVTIEQCLELAPDNVIAYAKGLWEHQIGDQSTGNFSRHAHYDKGKPRVNFDFEKEASFFIHDWSWAYAETQDPAFDHMVQVMNKRYMNKLNARNLVEMDASGQVERAEVAVPLWMLSMATECGDAATRMPESTAKALRKNAAGHDKGFLALGHAPADPEKGFFYFAHMDTGEPFPMQRKKTDGYSAAWGLGYGIHSTAMFAPLAYTRQLQLGDTPEGDAYRKLVLEAADLYIDSRPSDDIDVWAGEYGAAIFTELAAYRISDDSKYLEAAKEIGELAIKVLWDNGSNPLPRGSSKIQYYDVTSYPDTVMLALLALHEAVNGLGPNVPVSDIIR